MRNLILIALVAFAGWKYLQTSDATVAANDSTSLQSESSKSYNSTFDSHFSCDGRQYCSQMTSREEAVFFINNCPNTKMDGDRDGVPCESDSRF